MATSVPSSANTVDQFSGDFYREYTREMQFRELMGKGSNHPIQVKEELTKMAGDQITIPLVRRLQQQAITGDSDLEGNEESLVDYGHQITVNARGNAVTWGKMAQQKTKIDYMKASKPALKDWAMEDKRNLFLERLYSPVTDGLTLYDAATAAQTDAWLDANIDRVLYGAGVSNLSTSAPAGGATYDHSASLANLDNTSDKLTGAAISLMKRRCKKSISGATAQRIRPYRIDGKGNEVYVLLCGSFLFRDVKSNLQATFRDGWTRGKDNPVFKDGDLWYDGVIIKEVPEIGFLDTEYLTGAGNSIDLGACFMLGAQALGMAVAQRSMMDVAVKGDYKKLKRKVGVACDEIFGIEKLMYNNVQHGVHTGFFAAVSDA